MLSLSLTQKIQVISMISDSLISRKRLIKFTFLLKLVLISLFSTVISGCAVNNIYISSIYDGDTLTSSSGSSIRLLQIDTPELDDKECYALEAKAELERLLNPYVISDVKRDTSLKDLTSTSPVYIETDPQLDSVDKFNRDLKYLWIDKINVNIWLVQKGFATPYFYKGQKGKYADELLRAAETAEKQKAGIWGNCPDFNLNVYGPVETGAAFSSSTQETDSEKLAVITGGGNCSKDYKECVPNYPPDVNCPQLKHLGLIHVIGADPHRLDRDGDGLGCESNAR